MVDMHYLAIIGDICGSRHVTDREGLQSALREVLNELNDCRAESLVSPFTITLGDEYQALLANAKHVWVMVATIQARLYPVRVRFGIGLGAIDTAINAEAAIGMDGPAFHRAREAIVALKKNEGCFRVEGMPREALVNHSLMLVSQLQEQWHENRFNVYRAFLAEEPVQQTAEALAISKAAVYKNINDGMLDTIRGIQLAISDQLDQALAISHGV